MSNVETINPIALEKSEHAQKQAAVHQSENKKKKQQSDVDPLLLAYLEIYKAVQVGHETAGIQSKQLQANNSAQNKLINNEAQLNFSTISKSEMDKLKSSQKNTFLQELNDKNQEISALRNNIGDKLNVLNQDNQTTSSGVNSIVGEIQQMVSEGSSVMNMEVSITNQVAQG